MIEDRTPVLIGAGQFTQRDVDPAEAKEPLLMMVETARRAAADAGADARLLTQLDTVAAVNVIGWHYPNAPQALSEQLGAHPTQELYTTVGGNTPQWLVNEIAAQIAAGRVRLALLAGAEAVHTLTRARRTHTELRWNLNGSGTPTRIGDPRAGVTDHETAHGLQAPVVIYPLFENALRPHYGITLSDQQSRLGVLCSRMSAVAAQNPYAWFQRERSPEEIVTLTPTNRLIGFPYPKYMNAILDVDQSAAVLMTSVAHARQLGIDPARWVYLRGCADAYDQWFVSERVDYHSSPALRLAGQKALAMAGVGVERIDYFDLYSCFPSAVQIARDMLGIAADDPRALTVTGGLPYHGGPGNNYSMHAIATMMAKVRAMPGATGLVSALGWYMTKYAIGIYSAAPKDGPWVREDPAAYQSEIDRLPGPPLAMEPEGRAQIETYTVIHDRDGTPVRAIVIGRLADGRRFLANTPENRAVFESLMRSESIARAGRVSSSSGANCFDPDV